MIFPYLKEAVSNLFSRPVPIPFPQPGQEAKKDYRGRIVYDADRCVNCGSCLKVCSPGAITRLYEEAEGGKQITYVFDLTSCTFCGMCQDFCEEKAISLTADYHMVARNAADLKSTGTRFAPKMPDLYCGEACIHCSLCQKACPQSAITVDRKAKTWEVDLSRCVQCGICIRKCPKKTLSFGEPPAAEAAPADAAPANVPAVKEKAASQQQTDTQRDKPEAAEKT